MGLASKTNMEEEGKDYIFKENPIGAMPDPFSVILRKTFWIL